VGRDEADGRRGARLRPVVKTPGGYVGQGALARTPLTNRHLLYDSFGRNGSETGGSGNDPARKVGRAKNSARPGFGCTLTYPRWF
jgi:S-adenosylmethionine synthetase